MCDVTQLVGFNRALTTLGLRTMSSWGNPGLKALFEVGKGSGPASVFHVAAFLGTQVSGGKTRDERWRRRPVSFGGGDMPIQGACRQCTASDGLRPPNTPFGLEGRRSGEQAFLFRAAPGRVGPARLASPKSGGEPFTRSVKGNYWLVVPALIIRYSGRSTLARLDLLQH